MGLSSMPLTQFNSGSIALKDGTPLTVTLQFGMGDFSVSGLCPNLREVTAYESRGVLIATRQTTRVYPTLTFSAMVAEFSEATAGTICDMIHGTSQYAARVSTRVGDAMCFDVVLTIEGTNYGGVDCNWTFEDVHIKWDYAQGDPDKVSFSGTVYGNITTTAGGIAITAG